ncbi:PREDICTED: mitochondrial metalloendopeptidase OMA1-like [Camelina sativa]|uniref:Mitochondrial metalloendopeptidase OMA1-like n=1 Tax=Camelina sativa TaxID=90675 RepID=A0ABM0X941_CAMSA|nr:PREDICTED: mitochondrial metalloendopeptidase OMA1-like [Camelina sativa]
MSWYRRTKLVFDTLRRNINPKILPRSRNHVPSKTNPTGSSSNPTSNFSGFSSIPSLGLRSYTSSLGQNTNRIAYNPFLSLPKRHYYVDRYQVRHFKPRGPRRWFQNPRAVLTVTLVGSASLITLYFGNLETVPYTKRTHFILLSKPMEKRLGEAQFEQIKKQYKGKILPAIHPESIRVRLIAKEVIDALQRGLSNERVWTDLGYASTETSDNKGVKETAIAMSGGEEETLTDMKWSKEDQVLDDSWIQQSRKKDSHAHSATSHLEGINWEVLVVNQPDVNAFCMPGGKIVVFTGLLNQFKSDAEVATVIGHEVGHAVARHIAEGITKNLWFAILQLVLYQFVMPDLVNTMSALFLKLPFSRKMEMEADYIGLLLLASAGYDPRVAPTVYEKLGKLGGDKLGDYLSTHPSGKTRSKLLAQAHVMEEALMIYREIQSGRQGIEGFL